MLSKQGGVKVTVSWPMCQHLTPACRILLPLNHDFNVYALSSEVSVPHHLSPHAHVHRKADSYTPEPGSLREEDIERLTGDLSYAEMQKM
jgi:hypothetical protein